MLTQLPWGPRPQSSICCQVFHLILKEKRSLIASLHFWRQPHNRDAKQSCRGIRIHLTWELSVLVSTVHNRGLFSDNAASIFTLQIPPHIPNVCAQAPEPTQPAPPQAQASICHAAKPPRPLVPHRTASARHATQRPALIVPAPLCSCRCTAWDCSCRIFSELAVA